MKKPDLQAIAVELNSLAHDHAIGRLQDIRLELKGFARRPGSDIFSSQTIKPEFAFHHGGRSELQFNIGLEGVPENREFRYGVAFSFETSRTLPSIDQLIPKVVRFNDFMQLNGELFADMRMWHFDHDDRSESELPGPIPWERVKEKVFVFLGFRVPFEAVDREAVLDAFDRLLPLYKYVESAGTAPPISMPSETPFTFRHGCSLKASSALATLAQRELDVILRHNDLQAALHHKLISEFGAENVGTEIPSGIGTRIDVVLRNGKEYWFYEIKTDVSPRACLRQAIGQLLEYAFWPKAKAAARLIVVGESPIDEDGAKYLDVLNERFSLPIAYEQVSLSAG